MVFCQGAIRVATAIWSVFRVVRSSVPLDDGAIAVDYDVFAFDAAFERKQRFVSADFREEFAAVRRVADRHYWWFGACEIIRHRRRYAATRGSDSGGCRRYRSISILIR
jgi:hypothetical protein